MLAVHAIFLFHGDVGIAERDTALLRDALADLFHIEQGNFVDGRNDKTDAEKQCGWQYHGGLRHPVDALYITAGLRKRHSCRSRLSVDWQPAHPRSLVRGKGK